MDIQQKDIMTGAVSPTVAAPRFTKYPEGHPCKGLSYRSCKLPTVPLGSRTPDCVSIKNDKTEEMS